MTEQSSSGGIGGKLIVILGVALALGVGGLLLLLVMIAGMAGGGDSSGGNAAPACTPGNSENAGIEVPDEYEEYISEAAAESGFSVEVIAAQIQHESSWDPEAESPVGAQGIAQFMPATWESFGEGGDVFDPEDAIAAQGRYMGYLRDFMEDHADDDAHLLDLALAGYNAGEGAVQNNDFDLDALYASGSGYNNETRPYVANIKTAAEGNYSSGCTQAGDVPSGDITEAAMHLAWDEKVEIPHSSADEHGREDAKEEYVEATEGIAESISHAYFTDCGAFVATVMITSGVDPDYPPRGTSRQLSYLMDNDEYEFFTPNSEGELESGDILIVDGHTYIYTGERNERADGRAVGASLYTRPPSGHEIWLSDSNGAYHVARHKGESSEDSGDDSDETLDHSDMAD